jgi:hypothetical protein
MGMLKKLLTREREKYEFVVLILEKSRFFEGRIELTLLL